MRKVLITGGDGFLAKSFAARLFEKYELVICSRSSLDLSNADAVKSFLQAHDFDVVIHTATYDAAPRNSPKDPNKVLENNLRMFYNLARNKDYFGKMLFFGSGAEFSREHWQPYMKESYFDTYVPTDQYGYSKYLMTQYALTTSNIFNLRLFGVFGEYDDWRYRFIPNACAHAVMGQAIHVHNNAIVDYLYIDDLVSVVTWFIENTPRFQVYNVCTGIAKEHIAIADMISDLTQHRSSVVVNNKQIVKQYSGANGLLLNELGDFEFTPMKQALTSLYSWYENNKNSIDVKQFHF